MHKKVFSYFIIIITIILLPFNSFAAAAENNDGSVADFFNNQLDEEDSKKPSELPPETSQESNTVGITAGEIFQSIFSLLIVLGLLFAVLKWIQKSKSYPTSQQFIKNLGGTSVGQNRSIQLIKVGESILVVGVGDSVQVLKEIKDTKDIEYFTKLSNEGENENQPNQTTKILNNIQKFLNRKSDTGDNKESPFKSQLDEQLNSNLNERKELFEEIGEGK